MKSHQFWWLFFVCDFDLIRQGLLLLRSVSAARDAQGQTKKAQLIHSTLSKGILNNKPRGKSNLKF